jgi:DNA-binding transcriptional MerR regulator
MTDRGALPPKLYFRIGEVAGLVGVEPHVLRYWEREFRSIRPTKSAKGQRVYSRRDVENLLRVRELLYGQGFTIAGARKKLRDKEDAVAETDGALSTAERPLDVVSLAPANESGPALESPSHSPRLRVEIESLKAEVEAFLAELGGSP